MTSKKHEYSHWRYPFLYTSITLPTHHRIHAFPNRKLTIKFLTNQQLKAQEKRHSVYENAKVMKQRKQKINKTTV